MVSGFKKKKCFRFWQCNWYDDLCPYKADTIEDMETYILMYHNVRYKDDKIEIIKIQTYERLQNI